ncbi:Diphthamide biosynthesis protein 3 [Dermatophagoides pteronyssinus]|uniref:Diphthamide biosynthesis protein 3 n=2 Tax=Dermatophagoides pteronyssinus TaxID=6956 RepID=A0ABQ8JI32_DERPT|nr:DPH3 homolog [Dermatophagoides pteronyssinus]KAH9422097.1 Diphthamide biosynthesis protein 3 [Dermatophagoides pteronyssinus]
MSDSGVYHDEVEIEDFDYDPETETFSYPCPCGDLFTILKDDLLNGEVVASCVSCSLIIKVIYDMDDINNVIEAKETNTTKKPMTTEKITA